MQEHHLTNNFNQNINVCDSTTLRTIKNLKKN